MEIGLCRFLSTKSHLFPLAHYIIKSSDYHNKDNAEMMECRLGCHKQELYSQCAIDWASGADWQHTCHAESWLITGVRLFIASFTIWLFIELFAEECKPSLLFLLILNQGSISKMLLLLWINSYSEITASRKCVSPSAAEALFHLYEESFVPNFEGGRDR